MISDQFSRSADPNVSTLLVFHSLEEAAARGEKKLEVRRSWDLVSMSRKIKKNNVHQVLLKISPLVQIGGRDITTVIYSDIFVHCCQLHYQLCQPTNSQFLIFSVFLLEKLKGALLFLSFLHSLILKTKEPSEFVSRTWTTYIAV